MILKKIIGIDLGTTNSVIAVLEGSIPKIIPNSEGGRITPSVVAYTHKGEILIGQIAKRQIVINPENTFYSIKRFIGCRYSEREREIKQVSYNIIKNNQDNIKVYSSIINKELSPEEISALILKKLIKDANKFLNSSIQQAVITVPAYFNDSQRQATKDAGSIAGIDVLRILNEPTAAALAYGFDNKKNEIILVFDLGGGTFDVSILEVGEEVFEVLATSGDTHLGGDDFDYCIVDYILKRFFKEEKIDLSNNKQALQRIIEAAEKAKIELSILNLTKIYLPFIYSEKQTPIHIDFDFDRLSFENLTKHLLERCKEPVLKALADAHLVKSKIDKVILVGGSTRIPCVRNLISNLINRPINETVNPDEVVALGAAIQAGIIAGEITDIVLLDVTPLSLGVETFGGLMTKIIEKNSSIPANQSEVFSTVLDFQEAVEIHVLQGECSFAKDNKSLGIFTLNNIPKATKGIPQIKVTFQLDINGLLLVSAREESTGIEQKITIKGTTILSRDEIEKMIFNASNYASKDKIAKTMYVITYELDNLFKSIDILLNSKINSNLILIIINYISIIQKLYNQNNIFKINKRMISFLKYCLSFYLQEYLKNKLV